MSFHIGQKVVFVNNTTRPGCRGWDDDEAPKLGNIYTVLRCFVDHAGVEILWLKEIARNALSRAHWGPDVGYGAFRFRPAIERKTSIAIFQRMLKPTDKVSA